MPVPVEQARLLASRATFGATGAVVERVVAVGREAWLDEQLAATLPDAEALLSGYTTLAATNRQNYDADDEVVFNELDHAMLLRAVHSGNQLYEVKCDFWSNHFNVWRNAKWLTQLKTRDDADVVRRHALGRFVDLLKASGRSPAMLVYLDNFVSNANSANGLNENWGRELLELHTLGIIKGEHVYTEADVRGVAKVMSGRTIRWADDARRYDYEFNPWMHSSDAVSILGGQWSRPARPNGTGGEGDGDSLLDFLARHASTARHIAYKLCRRFVADEPPTALVDRLAAVYQANDTQIRPVLRALFLSDEFRASAGQKVKRPNEWLYSTLRATKTSIDPRPSGQAVDRLQSLQASLGQPINGRPSPDGWPETAPEWISSEGLLKRWEYGEKIMRNKVTDSGAAEKVTVDLASLLPAPLPATTRELVVAIADQVFQMAISTADADAILGGLTISPTAAATTITANSNNLQATFGLVCAHPTFQRR